MFRSMGNPHRHPDISMAEPQGTRQDGNLTPAAPAVRRSPTSASVMNSNFI